MMTMVVGGNGWELGRASRKVPHSRQWKELERGRCILRVKEKKKANGQMGLAVLADRHSHAMTLDTWEQGLPSSPWVDSALVIREGQLHEP